MITPAVERLRDELGLPGMHVLQFALLRHARRARTASRTTREWRRLHGHARQRHDGRLVVVAERRASAPRPGSTRPTRAWSLIELAYSSVAALAIVPMQDVLGLGSEARMNTPGLATGTGRGGSSRVRRTTRSPRACAPPPSEAGRA